MKRIVYILTIFLSGLLMVAFTRKEQKTEDPVSFAYEVKSVGGYVYEVKITAKIEEPWHIYSQYTPADGPSLPTHISFVKNPLVEIIGTPQEKGNLVTKHEEVLGVNLKYYKGQVAFVQKVKLKAGVKTNLNGAIEYMACTDEHCLMPTTEKFTLSINK